MNIHELSNYNLADAIKFHDNLNPRLWGKDEHLRPEVREKLLEIAEDFKEFLGVSDLDIVDITVSGSNAALSYTPHSDIDLHLIVKMPADPVYRELFDAKKYQYNDMHNIKVRGYDVELYVQDAEQEHHSLGIYSVLNGEWISVPKRRRAEVDDVSTRSKYEDLVARIESALKSKDIDKVNAVWEHIKNMRKSGLAEFGEFGPENLAFKILRTQGYIKQLLDARAEAKDRELSLKERERQKQRVRYGFAEEGSTPDGVSPTTCMFLNEEDRVESVLHTFIKHTAKKLGIERMPEIILHRDDGWSKEAHSFGRYDPEEHTLHVALNSRHLLDILRTTAHELAHCRQHEIEPLPAEAGETGSDWENEAHASAGIIMRDFADSHPEYFEMEPVSEDFGDDVRNWRSEKVGKSFVSQGHTIVFTPFELEIYRGGELVYRKPGDFENLTRSQLLTAKSTVSKLAAGWKSDSVYEASGYIPTKKQARDPRFKTALTVDVHPGQTGREANKMALKTDAQGNPALLIKGLKNALREFKETGKLDVATPSTAAIAKKHGVTEKQILAQLKRGIAVEREHTSSDATAKEIALDHLNELPDYYTRLARVERTVNEDQSSVEAFIDKIYSEYPTSPFNPNQRGIVSGEDDDQTIALFELVPSKSVRGAVELHWIQAYPQRQGVGTAAIRELQAKARAAGIKMSLYPKPNGSVSQASLKRLYKRLGFNPVHKGAATMVWDPAVSEQVASKFSEYEIAIVEGGGDVTSAKQVTVYHGNQGGIHREFVTPMWWTESYDDAAYYATLNDIDGFVYKATLSCDNPYVISKQDANAAVQNWRKLAIKGYDCIHDADTGDWIPFYSKDINLIGYDSLDPEEVVESAIVEYSDFDLHHEFFEEIAKLDSALFEGADDYQKLKNTLRDFATPEPTVGKKYVYTSVAATPAASMVSIAKFSYAHEFLGSRENKYLFNINGKIRALPEQGGIDKGDTYQHIFMFDTKEDSDKMASWIAASSDLSVTFKKLD